MEVRETTARGGESTVLMVDEIQQLSSWSKRLKAEYDRVVRKRLPVHIVVTGSSSLTLDRGARESMAGRFEHLRLLHWPAAGVEARSWPRLLIKGPPL